VRFTDKHNARSNAARGTERAGSSFCCRRRALTLSQVRGAECSVALRDRQQRRIELNKRGVCRSFGGVAAIARSGYRDHAGSRTPLEVEESPLLRKTGFVFQVHIDPNHGTLTSSFLIRIGGTHVLGCALFDHEHGLVRPCSGLQECLVRFGIDEKIVEEAVFACLHVRRVGSRLEVGGEPDSFAIVLGKPELCIRGIFRAFTGWRIGLLLRADAKERDCQQQEDGLRSGEHGIHCVLRTDLAPDLWLHGSGDSLHF
jgi:hypothetical protein